MMSDYIYDVIGYNIVLFSVDWRLAPPLTAPVADGPSLARFERVCYNS
jgi:hypothetical protein